MLRAIGLFIVAALAAGALYFVFVLPGQVERSLGAVEAHEPYAVSGEAEALHERLFIADLHADTLLWKRDPLARANRGHVDLPRLREGNVALQVFAATTKTPKNLNYEENTGDTDNIATLVKVQLWPMRTWSSPYQRALYIAQRLHRAATRDGDLLVIEDAGDLVELQRRRDAGDHDAVGGLLAIEGLHALDGDLAHVETLYDAGYRMMGITHFFDNALGGSLHGVSNAGLTDFGRDVVDKMDRLGIIIDLAHASTAVAEEVLERSPRPVVVSHTGFKGACDTPRNYPDALMVRIAEAGGLIGVGYWDAAACDISVDGVARSIVYGVNLVGANHVALGSDFDGATTTQFDTSELAALTDALLAQGLSEDQIAQVMGGNVARFLAEALPAE